MTFWFLVEVLAALTVKVGADTLIHRLWGRP